MRKLTVSILALSLGIASLLGGCDDGSASSAAASDKSASLANSLSDSMLQNESETTTESDAASVSAASNNSPNNSSSTASAAANNKPSSQAAANTSSKSETATAPVQAEAYVRFKLTGGDPNIERILVKDMDGKGFIGSCPQSYLNTMTNEMIDNACWKSDSKFRNYIYFKHSSAKLYFDGSEDVEVPEEKSTLLKAPLPMTIAAWIKPDGSFKPEANPDFRLIASYGSNNGTREHWDFKLNSDNTLSFFSADIPSDARSGIDSSYKVPNDVWTHVALQVSTTGLTYFVNGEKVDSKTFKSPIKNDTNGLGKRNFAIGALTEGLGSFRGGMAEFAIYKGLVDPKDTTTIPF